MMAPAIPCTVPECEFSTPLQLSSEAAMRILLLHRQDVHQIAEPPPPQAKQQIPSNTARVEKPTRPAVTAGMNESDWNFFLHEWRRYSHPTGIKDEVLRDELWSCMETDLRQLAFSEGFSATTEDDLLQQIKRLAVTVLHPSVHVITLHSMTQQEGETTTSFAARVKKTAGNCNLSKICSKADFTKKVSFMEETVYHVVMSGISDKELREKVLTQAMLTNVRDLPTLLNYVTAEESARVTTGVHDLSHIGGLQRRGVEANKPNLPPNTRTCGHCGQPQHGEKNKDRVHKCKAYNKECAKCQKMHLFATQCRSAKAAAVSMEQHPASADTVTTGGITGFMSTISTMHITNPVSAKPLIQAVSQYTMGPITTLPLPHYTYSTTESCWKQCKPRESPTLMVSLRLDRAAYGELKLGLPKLVKRPGAGHTRAQRAVTDTGAQLTVIKINISDIRAWFGLVNQVSYSFSMAATMAPFRHLLSTKLPFYCSEELQTSFEASKEEIIRQCIKGVRSFHLNAPTALATDWYKLAVGCWLTQKCCDCEGPPRPGCCPTGWQTVMIASHFCSPAERRYHPIEGEAFASAWALEKCRMFVLGQPQLILAVDHKPLLATLGPDQDLSTILNPRLLNFKLKTMAYKFTPMFIPGKAHVVPDTMSRRHDSPIADLPPYSAPPPADNNVLPGYKEKFGPPNWVSSPTVPALVSMTAIPVSEQPDTHTDEMEEMLLGQVISYLAGLTPMAEESIASFGAHNVSVITWKRLVEECKQSPTYQLLHSAVDRGIPDSCQEWDSRLLPYHRSRKGLSTLGPVVLHYDRPVIPVALRQEVMAHLHAAHGCANYLCVLAGLQARY